MSVRRSRALPTALTTAVLAGLVGLPAVPAAAVAPEDGTVFLNELHYDNDGTDTGELVEVAGPAGTDLTGWSVVLYNGGNGASYDTDALNGALPDQGDGFGTVALTYPSNGIQNGAPDGVALVDDAGSVRQFLSYEGTLTAANGPANGLTSTDIGVAEGAQPAGQSLQLSGTGRQYGDFTWSGPADDSPGAVNADQTYGEPGSEPEQPAPEDGEPTPVSAVQGAGASSPLVGETVTVEAVVTSLITANDVLDGFFVQEQDAETDDDRDTSEGVYVFCRTSCPGELAAGDVVRARGVVAEFFGTTQVDARDGSTTVTGGDQPLPTAAEVSLPAGSSTREEATFEDVEGMRTTIPTTLVVSEYFNLARFGELVLTAEERPFQFTQLEVPSTEGYADHLADLATRRIILDDSSNDQNDATSGPQSDEPHPYPTPGLSTENRFRGGDTVTGLTGVFEYSFGAWKLRPVDGEDYTFERANPRPEGPDEVGGRLRVASFNVLNYFATIDETSSDGSGACAPSGTADCRGADSEDERERQLDKMVAALSRLDADVLGLIEVQNDDGTATQQIVDALNAATAPGTYDHVRTGTIGTDAIKQAFVYRTATVQPAGEFALLTSEQDERFVDTKNRPALIQTFSEVATGEQVTIAVNHLKSKGSKCGEGDDSPADGSASCDGTRTRAAQALADFLATDPTDSGDPDVLIIGDLNSYRMERPITALEDAGYTDLLEQYEGEDGYSYVFDGQLGNLDHVLSTGSLTSQVTGAGGWKINADEPPLLDYNDTVRDAGEAAFERKSSALPLFAPDPFRSSDHDPAIVGLDLGASAPGGPEASASPTASPTSSPTTEPDPTSSPTSSPGPTSSPTSRPDPTSSPTSSPRPTLSGSAEPVRPAQEPVTTEEQARGAAAPGGTVATDGETADPGNPVLTAVTSPQGGAVSIVEQPVGPDEPQEPGYALLGQRVQISAPDATTDQPLRLEFRLDGSLLPVGEQARTVSVLRNGAVVDTGCAGERAEPDPCVLSRVDEGGDVVLTVLTSRASAWTFATPEPGGIAAACPGVSGGSGFGDVAPDSVHATAVACLRGLAVTQGVGGDGFRPAQSVTRGQMASFLARLLSTAGYELPAPRARFDDVAGVHAPAVDALAEAGVVRGVSATSYAPQASVTRAQMASLLQRTYALLGGPAGEAAPDAFPDDETSVHEPAIDVLARLGVTTGVAPDRYAPALDVRRDQMASFLSRLLSRLVAEQTVQVRAG